MIHGITSKKLAIDNFADKKRADSPNATGCIGRINRQGNSYLKNIMLRMKQLSCA